jgi:hypothetical protein
MGLDEKFSGRGRAMNLDFETGKSKMVPPPRGIVVQIAVCWTPRFLTLFPGDMEISPTHQPHFPHGHAS